MWNELTILWNDLAIGTLNRSDLERSDHGTK